MGQSANMVRIPLPDLMKGLAVIFMVMVHVLELFTTSVFQHSHFGRLIFFLGGPPAAPVFMAVAGYFFALSRKSFLQQIRRGFMLIILAFLLNVGLNFHLLLKIFSGQSHLNPLEYILGADILFLAGISILFLAVLRRAAGSRWYLYLLAALGFSAGNHFLPELAESQKYFQAFFWGNYSWSYFPVFPWAGYVFAGFAAEGIIRHLQKLHWKPYGYPLIWIGLSIPVFLFLPFASGISSCLPDYYHHSTVFFLWTLSFISWWILTIDFLETQLPANRIFAFLEWTGRNVTAFYVIQWLIIGNIATAIYQTQGLAGWLAGFIGVTVISALITYLYTKFKTKQEQKVGY